MNHALRVAVPARVADHVTDMRVIDVKPEALYDAYQTAIILGLSNKSKKTMQGAVYTIPESQLPCTWIGPKRGLRRYRGADIISYIEAGRRGD